MAGDIHNDRNDRGALSPLVLVVILLIFLMSGSAGLVYEVIWTRVLLTVFGATLYAVATVLAAFMGGLALGSLAGGRIADRVAKPLRLFALAEVLAAVFALLVPHMLALFDPVYRAVYDASGGEASFLGLSLLRFVLSFIVLLVPTTCMGATLPLLSRFLVRRPGAVGRRIGALYAVNTFGAVVGTFLAGFLLIARFGVGGTIFLAAMADIAVAVVAMLVSLRLERGAQAPADQDAKPQETETADEDTTADVSPAMARLVLITYGISGFVALAYQVFWTRALVFRFEFLKNTTYSFSAMLTVFLIGLAAGSAVMSGVVGRYRRPLRLYGLIQLLIGLSGAFSLIMLVRFVPLIRIGTTMTDTGDFDWLNAVVNVFARTFATIGLPTFLMGMAFPVAARICVRGLGQVGRGTGRLYAANTLGSIVGSFAAGFVLVPLFGLTHGLLVLGLVNVAIGGAVLLLDPSSRREPSRYVAIALAALAFAIIFVQMRGRYAFQEVENALSKIIDYREGPLATVAVVENSIGDRTIYVDNVGVAGTDRILLTDQKSLAHLPMLVLEDPKSALTVGFGSGGASYSYTLYPELERIDCIEICNTVLQAAPYLKASNHGVLDDPRDPRYRIIIDDARSYLRFTDTRYDIIATDCTDLRYKSNANLYDVEYFELCRDHLTDKGAVVVWMPLGGMTSEVFLCALKTFASVFPDMTIWFMNNEPTHYILLLGLHNDNPLRIDLDRFLERANRPEVQTDLSEISLQQPAKILSCYVCSSPELEEAYRKIPLNTEDSPFLEFESPKYGYGDEPVLDNLALLMNARKHGVGPYLADPEKHRELIARLQRFEAAVPDIDAGHAHLRRLELHDACASYLKAKKICPEDKSIDFLLRFWDLRRSANRGNNAAASTILGELELMQGKPEQAAGDFAQAMSVLAGRPATPDNKAFHLRAVAGLARCYLESGRAEAGLRFLADYEATLRESGNYEKLREAMLQANRKTGEEK